MSREARSSRFAEIDIETNVEAPQLNGLRAQVDELLGGLVDEAVEPLPRESWRLTTGDFGPHNMLFAPDGDLTVVDFEAAGWDDPAHAVMSFVAHAASEDLPPGLSTLFLGEFTELAQLSAAENARYERVGRLMDLEWVAVYASALSADNIANKQSAIQGFPSMGAYLDWRLTQLVDGAQEVQRAARLVSRGQNDGSGPELVCASSTSKPPIS